MRPMINWYFFNKARQAIWVGDFTRAREFLEKTVEVFKQESELEITNNLLPHPEWDEIIHEAVTQYRNRHQRSKSRVKSFDHISATLSACHYLMKRVRDAEHHHMLDSRIIQENMNVFLAAYPAGEMCMLVRGYAPSNNPPHIERVHEHLEHFKREQLRNDRKVSHTISEAGDWLSCVVHGLRHSYIGTATIFFAPWFLIQGSITYGLLDANAGLKRAARDFLEFLACLLTD